MTYATIAQREYIGNCQILQTIIYGSMGKDLLSGKGRKGGKDMTNFERIKELDFDNMVSLFAWGCCFYPDLEVPTCDEGCPDYGEGCMNGCSHDKQERAVREWLESECDVE